jgi:hypothetical protein
MISLRKGLNGDIELITLVDISTMWEDKQNLAHQMAMQLRNLNHRNILNITKDI